MSRATSASVFGSKPPVDESRMPARRASRAYGLRSESAPSGWYSAGARPSVPRRRRNGPVVSNLPDPAVLAERAAMAAREARERADEDVPVRRGATVRDLSAERHAAGVIRMGDLD